MRIPAIKTLDSSDSDVVRIFVMALTLKALAKRHSIPYSTLAGWIERGLIEIHGRTGRSGSAVTLNEKNVKELENLIRLRKGGLSLQRAQHLMEYLRATGYNPLSRGLFVVIDSRKGRVLRISESRRAAREVAGPYKQQTVMVELIPELTGSEAGKVTRVPETIEPKVAAFGRRASRGS